LCIQRTLFHCIELQIILIMPTMVSPFIAIILNVFLTIKAHQIHKQIDKETTLHGINSQSEQMTSLEKKLSNLKRHMKPVKTLLVVVWGGAIINMMFIPFFYLGQALIDSQAYREFMLHVVAANNTYVVQFLHPLVYGLYFKQVREPMMRCLKGMLGLRKINAIAPVPQRTAEV